MNLLKVKIYPALNIYVSCLNISKDVLSTSNRLILKIGPYEKYPLLSHVSKHVIGIFTKHNESSDEVDELNQMQVLSVTLESNFD